MTKNELLFCKCINYSSNSKLNISFTNEEIEYIEKNIDNFFYLARKHNLLISLYDTVSSLPINIDKHLYSEIKKEAVGLAFADYHMIFFTKMILNLLNSNNISYVLLKGISISNYYNKFEFRGFGDVDIFIPDRRDFKKFKNILLKNNFYSKSGFAEHHLEFIYNSEGINFILEVHHKIISRQSNVKFNRNINNIFSNSKIEEKNFSPGNISYKTFNETDTLLYLLLHMLQHFCGSGFGIKLLTDWNLFLINNHDAIDLKKYNYYMNLLGLSGFSSAMTTLCKICFNLPDSIMKSYVYKQYEKDYLNSLFDDLLTGGEFGKDDQTRMVAMAKGGHFTKYFYEVHRQTKRRFKTLSKIPPLWPLLWIVSIICFICNNIFVRKTSTKEILSNANKRKNILEEFELFKTGGKQ